MTKVEGARQDAAAKRFRTFFEELRGAFMERGDVLAQVALALLSKEHVLLTGPPGTAKSQIAAAVFGRILCEESGSPSLYSRQITESTVQTDLIGPIDFKNLTETGRTKHFTDEGMLGSVHAFLDEVFDGRDMLLRSALNVLQEREVKQGGSVAKGRIECALMTSNRYISDVLEQSRETLLAFVDRIAFIGFVPRGFSEPAHLATVLRRNVGGLGKPRLDALLTIQDIDVLQAMVDEVYVAPELCDHLALFLSRLDGELASASRADPSFTQTRYISTRTAVKCGQILRASCVFDRVFRAHTRPLQVSFEDFELLRLHLLLTGPTPDQAGRLMAAEVSPIEKRQLAILRSEREIFQAVLRKLPPVARLTPPVARETPPPPAAASSAAPNVAGAVAAGEKPVDPTRELSEELWRAEERRDHVAILGVAKRASELTREPGATGPAAHAVLERATRAASTLAMLAAFEVVDSERPVLASVRAVVELARSLEDGTASLHKAARWTQERALELIHDVARNVAGSESTMLSRAARGNLGDPAAYTASRLDTLGELATMRKQLLAESASRGLEADDAAWTAAIDEAERLLAACWGRSFVTLMVRERGSALASVLEALGPELNRLALADERLSEIGGRPARLRAAVVGPRLEDILTASLRSTVAQKQGSLVDHVRKLRELLDTHALTAAITPVSWLRWAAGALLAVEPSFEGSAPPDGCSLSGYRALRAREQRASVSCTLAEIALMVAPPSADPDPSTIVAEVMSGLDDETKTRVSGVDIARASRAVEYLTAWVSALEGQTLEEVATSRLFELIWDEAALTRFSMEARLVGEVLPHTEPVVSKLRADIDALTARAHQLGVGLLDGASASIWQQPPA